MEPLPETLEALKEVSRYGDDDVAVALWEMSRNVRRLVPECVGLSLGTVDEGVVFTMIASGAEVAQFDSVQYLDDGPCVRAAETGTPTKYQSTDPLDERQWHMFARAVAAHGVGSTLSFPLLRAGTVIGGVNLYASTAHAFDGLHDDLAFAVGGWAPGVVRNADLGFRTREEAVRAPDRLRAQNTIDLAVAALAEIQDIEIAEAKELMAQAAARAGIDEAEVAKAVINILKADG